MQVKACNRQAPGLLETLSGHKYCWRYAVCLCSALWGNVRVYWGKANHITLYGLARTRQTHQTRPARYARPEAGAAIDLLAQTSQITRTSQTSRRCINKTNQINDTDQLNKVYQPVRPARLSRLARKDQPVDQPEQPKNRATSKRPTRTAKPIGTGWLNRQDTSSAIDQIKQVDQLLQTEYPCQTIVHQQDNADQQYQHVPQHQVVL